MQRRHGTRASCECRRFRSGLLFIPSQGPARGHELPGCGHFIGDSGYLHRGGGRRPDRGLPRRWMPRRQRASEAVDHAGSDPDERCGDRRHEALAATSRQDDRDQNGRGVGLERHAEPGRWLNDLDGLRRRFIGVDGRIEPYRLRLQGRMRSGRRRRTRRKISAGMLRQCDLRGIRRGPLRRILTRRPLPVVDCHDVKFPRLSGAWAPEPSRVLSSHSKGRKKTREASTRPEDHDPPFGRLATVMTRGIKRAT